MKTMLDSVRSLFRKAGRVAKYKDTRHIEIDVQKALGMAVSRTDVVPNPLLKFPRNSPCFCNSGKKFKHCHLDKLPRACFEEKAAAARPLINHARLMAKAGRL